MPAGATYSILFMLLAIRDLEIWSWFWERSLW